MIVITLKAPALHNLFYLTYLNRRVRKLMKIKREINKKRKKIQLIWSV
jgi:hypothetical protein